MNSEDISLISSDPFIRKFVYAIIQNIKAKNFVYEEKHVIHSDLVPKVSEKVIQASLKERTTPKVEVVPIAPPVVVPKKRIMAHPFVPVARPKIVPRPRVLPRRMPPARAPAPVVLPQMLQVPKVSQGVILSQDYGKLTPLLNDPSISTIECSGANKPLMIIRAGQKQGTRISLSAEEIKEILQKVSDVVHIPLLEGVFRAAADNFSINAVISEMIGSRFVIKKQTAYAMLER